MSDYLSKEELIPGKMYVCDGRNLGIGTWNGKAFEYIRQKFGDWFEDVEYHWDDGPPHGTVKPLRLIELESEEERNFL